MPNKYEQRCGYSVERLDITVKKQVLDKWREEMAQDEWWDFVHEDAKRMGALMGIEVDDIQFSGFWSQGDGASYTGRYEFKPGAVETITEECGGQDKELIRIAEELTKLQVTMQLTHGVTFECRIHRQYDRYVHEFTMEVGDWGKEDLIQGVEVPWQEFRKLLRAFASWIYRQLEAEYEHLTSDDVVLEDIAQTGLRFNSSGETIRL